MNLQNMEYFLSVAEEGSITRAAKRLHISQQALSNSIARLETELGCRLFDRRQGLELTYGGRQYRLAAERILDIQKQTEALLHDISGNVRGELRIGISHTRGQALLPLILPSFMEKYPQVELSVLEGDTRTLENHLEHGDIDVLIGFAPFRLEGAVAQTLMRDRLFLVLPRTLLDKRLPEPGRAEEQLALFGRTHDLGLFRDYPFVLLKEGERIRTIAERLFREQGFRPQIRIETRNMQTAVALAAEGVGLTICPSLYLHSNYVACGMQDTYIRRRVELCPLYEENEGDSIAIGYHRDRYLSRIAEDFIQMSLASVGKVMRSGE